MATATRTPFDALEYRVGKLTSMGIDVSAAAAKLEEARGQLETDFRAAQTIAREGLGLANEAQRSVFDEELAEAQQLLKQKGSPQAMRKLDEVATVMAGDSPNMAHAHRLVREALRFLGAPRQSGEIYEQRTTRPMPTLAEDLMRRWDNARALFRKLWNTETSPKLTDARAKLVSAWEFLNRGEDPTLIGLLVDEALELLQELESSKSQASPEPMSVPVSTQVIATTATAESEGEEDRGKRTSGWTRRPPRSRMSPPQRKRHDRELADRTT